MAQHMDQNWTRVDMVINGREKEMFAEHLASQISLSLITD